MKFTEDLAKKIINALDKKGAKKRCPRCDHKNFRLIEGYFNHYIEELPAAVGTTSLGMTSIVTVCENCGYMAQHAIVELGSDER